MARIALPAGGAGVIASGGFIWVTSPVTGQIFKVDPGTNTVAATLDVGGSPRFIAAGEGALWVIDQHDGTVQRIDPESGSVVARIVTGEGGTGRRHRRRRRLRLGRMGEALLRYADRPGDQRGRGPLRERMSPNFSMRYGAGSVWIVGSDLRRLRMPVPE